MSRTEEHLHVVESACAALDGVGEYGIWQGDASGLLVLHGLAMYAPDTARSASLLLRDGRTLSAAALTRVVIEHAVLAQWLKADAEGRGPVPPAEPGRAGALVRGRADRELRHDRPRARRADRD